VPPTPGQGHAHAIDGRYVNRRGIYKDSVGSSQGWPDYQLRPNGLVAMAVAPALFQPQAAQTALAAVEQQLLWERQVDGWALQRSHLETSPEGGQPELTNAGGAFCRGSCTSQAWSSSTLLNALWDLQAHVGASATAAARGSWPRRIHNDSTLLLPAFEESRSCVVGSHCVLV